MLNETEKKDTGVMPDGTENKDVVLVTEETENNIILPDQAESDDAGILPGQTESSNVGVPADGTINTDASALLHETEDETPYFLPDDPEDYEWEERKRRGTSRGKIRSWIEGHKLLTAVLVIWFLYMMMYVIIFGGLNKYMTISIDITALVSLALTAFAVFCLFVRNVRPENLFLPVFLLTAILFMLIMPLGQNPDEPAHLWQTYHVSNKMLGVELSDDGHLIMEKSDRDVPMLGIPSNAEIYVDYWEGIEESGRNVDTSLVKSSFKPISEQDYLYLPQAAGVTIGRLLHLPSFWKFMLGRLFNLLVYAFLAFAAMKLMPFGKMAVFVLSMTPISVQQSSSLSYDALINGIAILITALAFHLAFIEEPKKKAFKIILLWITTLLLVPVKGGAYLPISLLPVIVWLYKRKSNRVLGGAAMVAALVCVVFFAVTRFVPLPAFAEDTPTVTEQSVTEETPANIAPYITEEPKEKADEKELLQELSPQERELLEATDLYGKELPYTSDKGYSLQFFLHRPLDIFGVIGNTMQVNGGWYLESFLGNDLGWLTIGVSRLILYLLALLLFLSSIRENDEGDFCERTGLITAGVLSIISILLIFGGMLLSWSTVKGGVIAGVQGRYFIPVALPLLMLFRVLPVKKESGMNKHLVLVLCLVLFFVMRCLLLGLNVAPD